MNWWEKCVESDGEQRERRVGKEDDQKPHDVPRTHPYTAVSLMRFAPVVPAT